jgi:hypothetical protein
MGRFSISSRSTGMRGNHPYATLRVRMPIIIGIRHPSVNQPLFGGLPSSPCEVQFKSVSKVNVDPPPALFRATSVLFCPEAKETGPVSTRTRVVPGAVKNTL